MVDLDKELNTIATEKEVSHREAVCFLSDICMSLFSRSLGVHWSLLNHLSRPRRLECSGALSLFVILLLLLQLSSDNRMWQQVLRKAHYLWNHLASKIFNHLQDRHGYWEAVRKVYGDNRDLEPLTESYGAPYCHQDFSQHR